MYILGLCEAGVVHLYREGSWASAKESQLVEIVKESRVQVPVLDGMLSGLNSPFCPMIKKTCIFRGRKELELIESHFFYK